MNSYDRFKDAIWFKPHEEKVVIGGAGGIGSWLTFFLNRAGFTTYVYDFDVIEKHNLGGQLFREKDVGLSKVHALYNIIKEFCGESINNFHDKFKDDSITLPFMFGAFDNMAARRSLFNAWKRNANNYTVTPILIDGRLEIESLQIFCVTPQTMDEYEEKYLFADSEVEDAPCTLRQTSHSAAMIASHMTAFFTNHITNIYEKEVVRSVPFKFEYFIPLDLAISE